MPTNSAHTRDWCAPPLAPAFDTIGQNKATSVVSDCFPTTIRLSLGKTPFNQLVITGYIYRLRADPGQVRFVGEIEQRQGGGLSLQLLQAELDTIQVCASIGQGLLNRLLDQTSWSALVQP